MKREQQTATYVGKFLGFTTLDGYKLKYFRMMTTTGEFIVKLPKEERVHFYKTLQPGDVLTTTVTECYDEKKGLIKRKAITIDKTTTEEVKDNSSQTDRVKVLVCGECKGCNQTIRQLQEQFNSSSRVSVKVTGCMKKCKQGPNLTITPLKRSFSQVQDISPIVNLINSSLSNSEPPII